MAKRFENIKVGDQLELLWHRMSLCHPWSKQDPNQIGKVAIVTHVWHDPVDDKWYVALAYLLKDGSHRKPALKHTITGLARAGWQYAQRDWVNYARTIHDNQNIISIHDERARKARRTV